MIDCHDLDLIWEFIFLSRKWQFMKIDWALKDNSTRVSTLKSMRLSQVILWVRYVDSLIYEHVGSKWVTFVLRCFWRVKWREKESTQEGRCASKRANMKTGQRDWCATRVRRTSKYCDGGQRRHRHSCNQSRGRDTPNEKRWNLKPSFFSEKIMDICRNCRKSGSNPKESLEIKSNQSISGSG